MNVNNRTVFFCGLTKCQAFFKMLYSYYHICHNNPMILLIIQTKQIEAEKIM